MKKSWRVRLGLPQDTVRWSLEQEYPAVKPVVEAEIAVSPQDFERIVRMTNEALLDGRLLVREVGEGVRGPVIRVRYRAGEFEWPG